MRNAKHRRSQRERIQPPTLERTALVIRLDRAAGNEIDEAKKEKQSGLDLPAASVAGGRLHLAVWLPPPTGSTDARCLQNNIFLTS